MNFRAAKEELEKSIAKVESIVPARETQTLLAHLLFTIEKDKLSLTASDMESTVKITLPATSSESGEITLRAKKISEIAKKIHSIDFNFTAEPAENAGDTISYNVKITGDTKASASYNMTGNQRGQFPAISQIDQNRLSPVSTAILGEMISKTLYSISQEDNRYIYNGLCFIFSDSRLTVVGTDGRRLAAISRDLQSPVQAVTYDGDLVVHARAIRQLQRLLDGGDDVFLGVQQRDIYFKIGESELSSRLLEGKFPEYQKVIPKKITIEFELNRDELVDALVQVMVMTELPSNQIRLTIDTDRLNLTANTPDLGVADISLPIEYSGEILEIGFNAAYILDILKSLSCSSVKLGFNNANEPIVISDTQDPDFIALVMPMKI